MVTFPLDDLTLFPHLLGFLAAGAAGWLAMVTALDGPWSAAGAGHSAAGSDAGGTAAIGGAAGVIAQPAHGGGEDRLRIERTLN